MDVASLVRSITLSFEDATALVKRIRDRNAEQSGDNGETSTESNAAISELLESLQLGPVVTRGYYASDAKRFGESYTNGDNIAREQLKDVLIHLQMTVLTTLRTVLVDSNDVDYAAIQTASDDCRVNAGVSLGQLSQRLADPTRAQASHNTSTLPLHIPTPALKYSSSRSTASSESPRTPTTPEMEAALDFDYPGRLPGFNPHASNLRGKAQAVLQGSPNTSPARSIPGSSHSNTEIWMRKQMEMEAAGSRRPSSSCLSADDHPVFSPVSPASSASPWNRESPVSSGIMSSFGSIIKKKANTENQFKDRFSPDDYLDTRNSRYSCASAHRKSPSESSVSALSHQTTDSKQSLLGRSYSPPSRPASRLGSRPPKTLSIPPRSRSMPRSSIKVSSPIQEDAFVSPLHFTAGMSSTSVNAPIPITEEDPIPPVPPKSAARKILGQHEPLKPGAKKILGDIDPYLDSFTGVLNLPSEKNLLGYCKSACRLQTGNTDKKAFGAAHRPVGYSSLLPFWKCEKCLFEGPMTTFSPPSSATSSGGNNSVVKSGKPEKIFDPAIREYDGIRFKWIFLAKCHVPMKSSAAGGSKHRVDGTSGSFGCIFCTAEGANRGWVGSPSTTSSPSGYNQTDLTNGNNKASKTNERPTTSSGRSYSKKKNSKNNNDNNSKAEPIMSSLSSALTNNNEGFGTTPIFGNSHSFMEHLQMHRQRNYWPNKEMQKRTRCIVGRVAGIGEDFEINLMPLDD